MNKTKSNTILSFALLAMLFSTAGCVGHFKSEPRTFFAADGLKVGQVEALKDGNYKLPIKLTTAITHSAQVPAKMKVKVDGKDILITADYRLSGSKLKYPGYAVIKGATPGTYQLVYRDPAASVTRCNRSNFPEDWYGTFSFFSGLDAQQHGFGHPHTSRRPGNVWL